MVPNGLSLARIVLGVVFYWLSPAWRVGAVFAAALSDALDGASSRWLRAASHTGRMLDPIADKAFVLGVVGTLLCEEMLGWREVILLSLRDLAVFVGVVWLLVQRDWMALRRLPPSWLGKATTVAQFAYVSALLLADWPGFPSPGSPAQINTHALLFTAAAVLSGLAALHYTWLFLTRRRRLPSPQPP